MIQIQPHFNFEHDCPHCGEFNSPEAVRITGMRTVLDIHCKKCDLLYLHEAPINTAAFYPGSYDSKSGKRIDKIPFDNWYFRNFNEFFENRDFDTVQLEVLKNDELGSRPVLLLNTIDATYGHALYYLFNASHYSKLSSEYDLVILVQKSLKWLLPSFYVQAWVVDIPFSRANQWHERLHMQLMEHIPDNTGIFLAQTSVQVDESDFSVEDYSGIKPFPLEEWDNRLVRPTLTIIWRHDRFWKKVLPSIIDNRFTRKVIPRLLSRASHKLQFRWLIQFCREIRKQVPDIDLAISGMDVRRPALPGWIKDLRFPEHRDEEARLQLNRYAQSHLIMGCNGSSLILPGCHAGAVVNLVPHDSWAVSAGSFPFRITHIGDTHYRYVMLPKEANIRRVVMTCIAILRDRSYINLQCAPEWKHPNPSQGPYVVRDERIRAFKVSQHFRNTKGLISK